METFWCRPLYPTADLNVELLCKKKIAGYISMSHLHLFLILVYQFLHGTVHGDRVLLREGDIEFSACPARSLDLHLLHMCSRVFFLRFVCHRGVGRLEIHMHYAIRMRCRCTVVNSSIERAQIHQTERQRFNYYYQFLSPHN